MNQTGNEFLVKNLEELTHFVDQFITFISLKKAELANGAIVVGLSGDLGAGKTTFSKKFAERIGVSDTVTSPTFVLQKKYKIPTNSPLNGLVSDFVHIDAYRLESSRELEVLGWGELITTPLTLVFIEWPEKVEGVLPENMIKIQFDFVDENTRRIYL
jgi:tRNA threonylcarbamoyladenosine biosynthesis protein TsaE